MQREMELLPHTNCAYCNEPVFSEDAVVRTYHTSQYTSSQSHFCSDNCAQLFYLSQMRRFAL